MFFWPHLPSPRFLRVGSMCGQSCQPNSWTDKRQLRDTSKMLPELSNRFFAEISKTLKNNIKRVGLKLFFYFSDSHPRGLMMRSATPVKSDASGSTVSGYGTADSGGSCGSTAGSAAGSACDKTPPYLPRNQFNHSATLGRMNQQTPDLHRQQQVREHS